MLIVQRPLGFLLTSAALLVVPTVAYADPAAGSGSVDVGALIETHARSAPIQAQVTAETDKKQASIKLDLLQLDRLVNNSASTASLNSSQLTLTVSTAWDGENDAMPVDLDGLADGTSAKLDYSLYSSKRVTVGTAGMQSLEEKATQICKAKMDAMYSAFAQDLGPNSSAAARTDLDERRKKALRGCDLDQTDGAALVNANLSAAESRQYATGFFARDSFAVGIHGAVGFEKFDFVNPLTLAKGDTKKTNWSAGLSFTNYFLASPTALALSMDYEEAYESADEQILCPAANGPGPVQCVKGPVGRPVFDKSAIARVNLRHRFLGSGGGGRIAISPLVSYDISDDVLGAELPIYFVPDKDGNLTGGFKIGYRSDTDKVRFGVFIGAAFGLVK